MLLEYTIFGAVFQLRGLLLDALSVPRLRFLGFLHAIVGFSPAEQEYSLRARARSVPGWCWSFESDCFARVLSASQGVLRATFASGRALLRGFPSIGFSFERYDVRGLRVPTTLGARCANPSRIYASRIFDAPARAGSGIADIVLRFPYFKTYPQNYSKARSF